MSLSATYNSITINWQPPTSWLRHGIVTGYTIRYTRLGTVYAMNGGQLNERNNAVLTDYFFYCIAKSLLTFSVACQHNDCHWPDDGDVGLEHADTDHHGTKHPVLHR